MAWTLLKGPMYLQEEDLILSTPLPAVLRHKGRRGGGHVGKFTVSRED